MSKYYNFEKYEKILWTQDTIPELNEFNTDYILSGDYFCLDLYISTILDLLKNDELTPKDLKDNAFHLAGICIERKEKKNKDQSNSNIFKLNYQ